MKKTAVSEEGTTPQEENRNNQRSSTGDLMNFVDEKYSSIAGYKNPAACLYPGIKIISFGPDEKEFEATTKRFSKLKLRTVHVKQISEIPLIKEEGKHHLVIIEEVNFLGIRTTKVHNLIQETKKKLDKMGLAYTLLVDPAKASGTQRAIFYREHFIDHIMKPASFDTFVLVALARHRQANKN